MSTNSPSNPIDAADGVDVLGDYMDSVRGWNVEKRESDGEDDVVPSSDVASVRDDELVQVVNGEQGLLAVNALLEADIGIDPKSIAIEMGQRIVDEISTVDGINGKKINGKKMDSGQVGVQSRGLRRSSPPPLPQNGILSARSSSFPPTRRSSRPPEGEGRPVTLPPPPALPGTRISTVPPNSALSAERAKMYLEQAMELKKEKMDFLKECITNVPEERILAMDGQMETICHRQDFVECFNLLNEENRSIFRSFDSLMDFITVLAKQGAETGKALLRAKITYFDDKSLFHQLCILGQMKGARVVDALFGACTLKRQSAKAFGVLMEKASKYSPSDITALAETAVSVFSNNPVDVDVLKKIDALIVSHGYKIAETIRDAKDKSFERVTSLLAESSSASEESQVELAKIHEQGLKENEDRLNLEGKVRVKNVEEERDDAKSRFNLFFEVMEHKGKAGGQILLKAANIFDNDLKKLEIMASVILRAESKAADSLFETKDLFEEDIDRMKQIADVAVKFGPSGCNALKATQLFWMINDNLFREIVTQIMASGPEDVESLANIDERVVGLMRRVFMSLVNQSKISAQGNHEEG